MSDTPWWDRGRHADRRPLLLARNRIRRALSDWFEAEGFTEVDPAALQVSPGNETHLHAFATSAILADGRAAPRYLHTSPEFAMKKLLAAGETRIFAFAHVWRNRERGAQHAPEFTMLEWYRVGEPYERLMSDCAALLARAARAAGTATLNWRGRSCDPFAPPERVALHDAVRHGAGIDLLATIAPDGTPDRGALADAMRTRGRTVDPDDDWSDLFAKLLVETVEPGLGIGRATVLDHYPAAEAALARRLPEDPRLSERFELFAAGVELANGFGELVDPVEQRARFGAEMDEKARRYAERYPIDEDFLAALSAMPPACGIALGFDRLVALATGASSVEAVMWAPPA